MRTPEGWTPIVGENVAVMDGKGRFRMGRVVHIGRIRIGVQVGRRVLERELCALRPVRDRHNAQLRRESS
mgnify:FL=1